MPVAHKKKITFSAAHHRRENAANSVKKTAVRQAIRSRMAMDFNAIESDTTQTQKIGFAFGKNTDSNLFDNCVSILKLETKKRSRPDIVMLLSLFDGNDFFAKLDYEVKLELASVMGLDR